MESRNEKHWRFPTDERNPIAIKNDRLLLPAIRHVLAAYFQLWKCADYRGSRSRGMHEFRSTLHRCNLSDDVTAHIREFAIETVLYTIQCDRAYDTISRVFESFCETKSTALKCVLISFILFLSRKNRAWLLYLYWEFDLIKLSKNFEFCANAQ